MATVDVKIVLRVPEGEEMTDERVDALYDQGFDDALVVMRHAGKLELLLTLDAADWEDIAETRAEELMKEMPDADVLDILLDED
ncbi:hypothetical protein ACOI1H_17700 [Loktanella sp. DJP18]|uniref:hypothetical protein n=1 Tax=Loktanella sp. DJP18 TaxID=3409788 RepID=UPI003BB7E758